MKMKIITIELLVSSSAYIDTVIEPIPKGSFSLIQIAVSASWYLSEIMLNASTRLPKVISHLLLA